MSFNNNTIIVFEGPDGSGKTTQCKNLVDYLNNNNKKAYYFKARVKNQDIYKTICTIEDNNNALPDNVFPKWLKSSLIAYERAKQLYDFFNEVTDSIIIVDKYIYSTELYLNYINIDPKYPEMLLQWLPSPDLVLYFYLPAEICMERINQRGGRIGKNENIEFLTILNNEMRNKIKKTVKENNVITIDANRNPDEIFPDVLKTVNNFLEDKNE